MHLSQRLLIIIGFLVLSLWCLFQNVKRGVMFITRRKVMSKFQQGFALVVFVLLALVLILKHQDEAEAVPTGKVVETLKASTEVKREECFVTFLNKRFDGHCEFRKDENGVRYLGLFGEDGQLDIIMRITGDNKGQAYYLSPRVMKRMREVSA